MRRKLLGNKSTICTMNTLFFHEYKWLVLTVVEDLVHALNACNVFGSCLLGRSLIRQQRQPQASKIERLTKLPDSGTILTEEEPCMKDKVLATIHSP